MRDGFDGEILHLLLASLKFLAEQEITEVRHLSKSLLGTIENIYR